MSIFSRFFVSDATLEPRAAARHSVALEDITVRAGDNALIFAFTEGLSLRFMGHKDRYGGFYTYKSFALSGKDKSQVEEAARKIRALGELREIERLALAKKDLTEFEAFYETFER